MEKLKLAPVLSQKSEKMHLVRTFCSTTAKTSKVTSIFYFMFLVRTVLRFDEKKNWHKPMLSFLAILLKLYGLRYHGWNRACPIHSTLERKAKTGALKGIFLVCKWINNTTKSSSAISHASSKKSLLFV